MSVEVFIELALVLFPPMNCARIMAHSDSNSTRQEVFKEIRYVSRYKMASSIGMLPKLV